MYRQNKCSYLYITYTHTRSKTCTCAYINNARVEEYVPNVCEYVQTLFCTYEKQK